MLKRSINLAVHLHAVALLLLAVGTETILWGDDSSLQMQGSSGRIITSPFGVPSPDGDGYSEGNANGVEGNSGKIITSPFGVPSLDGEDYSEGNANGVEGNSGKIITSPFGVPSSDLPPDGTIDDTEDSSSTGVIDSSENTSDADPTSVRDAADSCTESNSSFTSEKITVKDAPARGNEYPSTNFILVGSCGNQTVASETDDINNAPTLYVHAGGNFTLTLAVNQNLPTNIQPIFRKLNQSGTQNPFGPLQSGSNPPYCFVYHVPSTMDGGTYCASISCTFNGVPIERILKIEIVRVNKIVGPNSKSSTRSEAPSGTDKWQESEVIYAQPYSVFDLTMEVEPSLSYDKIKDLISWSKSGVGGTLTQKEDNKRKAEFKATSTGIYTVTASIGSSQKIIVVKVVAPKINTVQFGGAKISILRDNGTPYSGDAWKDDNLDGESELNDANAVSTVKFQPVAYKSTSKITAQGTFKPNCLKIDKEGTSNPVSSDFIQGWDVEAAVKKYRFSHDNLNWSNWTISGAVEGSNQISTAQVVGYNLTFPIYWQYGFGETGTTDINLNIVSAGTSKHEMYLTKSENDDAFETVLHISCTSANGKSDNDQIVASIWSNFSDLSVNKKGSNITLKYYGAGTNTGNIQTVAQLLSMGDGRCGAWARFFRDCILLHGVTAYVKVVKPGAGTSAAADGLLVKNWNVHMFTRTPYIFSHLLYTVSCSTSSPHQNGAFPSTGINGQGPNDRPQSIFTNHAVVKYSSTVYDPSYGGSYGYDSFLTDYKTSSIQGFYKQENQDMYATFNKDINNLIWGVEE